MIGSSLDFLIRSILFRMQEDRRLDVLHQVEHEPVALARRLGRIDHQAEHVHLAIVSMAASTIRTFIRCSGRWMPGVSRNTTWASG